MKAEKFKLQVTMIVEVEIDHTNAIVQEYDTTDELLLEVVSYRFSPVLPVMTSGVKVNFEDTSYEVLDHGIRLI